MNNPPSKILEWIYFSNLDLCHEFYIQHLHVHLFLYFSSQKLLCFSRCVSDSFIVCCFISVCSVHVQHSISNNSTYHDTTRYVYTIYTSSLYTLSLLAPIEWSYIDIYIYKRSDIYKYNAGWPCKKSIGCLSTFKIFAGFFGFYVSLCSRYKDAQSPKNNLNLRIQTEPVTAGANATDFVWLLFTIWHRNQTNTAESAQTEPVTVGAYATEYVWLLCTYVNLAQKPDKYRSINPWQACYIYTEILIILWDRMFCEIGSNLKCSVIRASKIPLFFPFRSLPLLHHQLLIIIVTTIKFESISQCDIYCTYVSLILWKSMFPCSHCMHGQNFTGKMGKCTDAFVQSHYNLRMSWYICTCSARMLLIKCCCAICNMHDILKLAYNY